MPVFLPGCVVRHGFPPPISCTVRTIVLQASGAWMPDFLFRPVPDVVHLPGAAVGGHQLELTCQGRPVPLMFPEDSAGRAGIGNEVPHLGRRKFRRIISSRC